MTCLHLVLSTLLLLSPLQLLFGRVSSQQAPLGSVLPSKTEQYGRVHIQPRSNRRRRGLANTTGKDNEMTHRRTVVEKAASVSSPEEHPSPMHKSDPDLTLVSAKGAESTAEEDQKFATEVVAAHQVDAIELPSKTTKHKKDQHHKVKDDGQQKKKKHKHKYEHMKGEYSCYRTVAGTMDTMYDIVATYPNLASIIDIGKTYLGFENKVLVLTSRGNENGRRSSTSSGDNTEKGRMFLTFGLHARELAPPELGIRWAEHLVKSYGVDADVSQVLDYNEIHMLLHANPDGRQIAEKNPSLGNDSGWRKNAHDYPPNGSDGGNGCSGDSVYGIANPDGNETLIYGVDLNRNFPYQWGGEGSSSNPCDDNYKGPSPYSPEPEVAAIMDYAKALFPRAQQRRDDDIESILTEPYDEETTGAYIDVHASGKVVGQPWYYKNITAPNIWELMALNHKFCSFNGHKPVVSGYDSFWYEAAGATDDYMYGSLGVAAFTFEVGHDQAENCNYFEKEIIPHNFHALLYGAKVSRAPYRIPKGPDVTRFALSRSLEDPDSAIRVEVAASDVHRTLIKDKRGVTIPDKYPVIPSGKQNVSSIQVFVDEHPYDNSNPLPYATIPTGISNSATESIAIDIGTSTLVEGQHTVCVQAVDSASMEGQCIVHTSPLTLTIGLSRMCVDSDRYFSLRKDTGSWVVRAKTCLNTVDEAEVICGRRVKYLGDTLVKDICPLRCDSECETRRL